MLIVAEAMHAGAADDVRRLMKMLSDTIAAGWGASPRTALLTAAQPVFEI